MEKLLGDNGAIEDLNFTHRAALGGGNRAKESQGGMAEMAKGKLEDFQKRSSKVFKLPTYPIDRSDCPA